MDEELLPVEIVSDSDEDESDEDLVNEESTSNHNSPASEESSVKTICFYFLVKM